MKNKHYLLIFLLMGFFLLGPDISPAFAKAKVFKKGKLRKIVRSIQTVISGSSAASQGGEEGLVAEYLSDRGRKHYADGNNAEAIHELSKALLVDPNNQEANYYLNKIGVDGGIYGRRRTSGRRSVDTPGAREKIVKLEEENVLREQIVQVLKEREGYLRQDIAIKEEKNNALYQNVEEKVAEIARLNMDLYEWKEKMARRLEQEEKDRLSREVIQSKKGERKQVGQEIKDRNRQIALLSKDLLSVRSQLAKESDLVKAGDQRLRAVEERFSRELKRRLKEQKHTLRQKGYWTQQSTNKESERNGRIPSRYKKDFRKNVEFLKRQDRVIADLKEKLVLARRGGSSANRAADERLTALERQLEKTRYQLNQKQTSLKRKENEYDMLELRFKDARERLDISEQMVREKDQETRELEEQLMEVLSQFEDAE